LTPVPALGRAGKENVRALRRAGELPDAGWPERFYIVDERGVIVYKSKPGPFGYHPEEVESWLGQRFPAEKPL
jgi:Iodothyronine deiodinase